MARKILSADEKKAVNAARRAKEAAKRAEKAQAEIRAREQAAEKERARIEEMRAKAAAKEKRDKRIAAAAEKARLEKARAAERAAIAAQKAETEVREAAAKHNAIIARIAEKRKSRGVKKTYGDESLGVTYTRAEWLKLQRDAKAMLERDKLRTRIAKIKTNKKGGVRSTIYTRRTEARPRVGHVGNRGELKDGRARVVYNTDVPPHTRDVYVSKRSNFALKYGA